jgi:hypothetical protein
MITLVLSSHALRHSCFSSLMLLSPLGERLGEGVMQETIFRTPSSNLSPKGERNMKDDGERNMKD